MTSSAPRANSSRHCLASVGDKIVNRDSASSLIVCCSGLGADVLAALLMALRGQALKDRGQEGQARLLCVGRDHNPGGEDLPPVDAEEVGERDHRRHLGPAPSVDEELAGVGGAVLAEGFPDVGFVV